MTHHNSDAATPQRCTEEKKTTTPRARKEVLLLLDVFFNRDELVTMNRFLRRHADSVRIVGADGEHHLLDVFQAMKFLTMLVKYSDQDNGMLTLEADANPRHLTYFEREKPRGRRPVRPERTGGRRRTERRRTPRVPGRNVLSGHLGGLDGRRH